MENNLEDKGLGERQFKASERIDGYIYILDKNEDKVYIDGKPKRFKTVNMTASFIHMLEERFKIYQEGLDEKESNQ